LGARNGKILRMANENTISGLLKKRGELLDEVQMLRESMALLSNDVESLDRVLQSFGYDGDLQQELATAASVSLSTIRDFEKGRRTSRSQV
jgi:hypothetical protein